MPPEYLGWSSISAASVTTFETSLSMSNPSDNTWILVVLIVDLSLLLLPENKINNIFRAPSSVKRFSLSIIFLYAILSAQSIFIQILQINQWKRNWINVIEKKKTPLKGKPTNQPTWKTIWGTNQDGGKQKKLIWATVSVQFICIAPFTIQLSLSALQSQKPRAQTPR